MIDWSALTRIITGGIDHERRHGRAPTRIEVSFRTYIALLEGTPNLKVEPVLTHLLGLRIVFNPKVKYPMAKVI